MEAPMRYTLLFAMLLAFFFGCTPQQSDQLTQQQKDQIKSEVKPVVDSILAKAERLDLNGTLPYFWDSPEFVSYNADGSRWDFQAFTKSSTDAFVNMAALKNTTAREEFRVEAKDLVIYSWAGKGEMFMKSGDKITEDPEATTWVFKKVDGQWKIIYCHDSGTTTMQKAGKK
jgi:hypothetical protein